MYNTLVFGYLIRLNTCMKRDSSCQKLSGFLSIHTVFSQFLIFKYFWQANRINGIQYKTRECPNFYNQSLALLFRFEAPNLSHSETGHPGPSGSSGGTGAERPQSRHKWRDIFRPISTGTINTLQREKSDTHVWVKAQLTDITRNNLFLLRGNGDSKRVVNDGFLHRVHLKSKWLKTKGQNYLQRKDRDRTAGKEVEQNYSLRL